MVAQIDVKVELRAATDRVLASKSTKKLVVAGPGTGKTYLFRELLKSAPGTPEQRLVLTFINMLKHDLDRDLGDISRVFTLHGYCQHLLRHSEKLRNGMSASFRCYPGLRHLIPKDWVSIREAEAPHFVDLMRNLSCTNEQASFCLDRTNYYDAVDFDDSVYRTYQQLAEDPALIPKYTLVLVDEFQDFNKMEASIIDLLARGDRMKRRECITLLGGAAIGLTFPAKAQQASKIAHIGYLSVAAGRNSLDETFEQALQQLGWMINRNITIEYRYAGGRAIERLPVAVA